MILVALGSNLPFGEQSPVHVLQAALKCFDDSLLKVEQVSRFFATPSFPKGSGPDFVNATARICGEMSPRDVLGLLHEIESTFGRTRDKRWGQRTLDLDLLAFGELVLPNTVVHSEWRLLAPEAQIAHTPGELILPHPRLQDRAFVLVPLAEIAPEWTHPITQLTVADMLAQIPEEEISQVRALDL